MSDGIEILKRVFDDIPAGTVSVCWSSNGAGHFVPGRVLTSQAAAETAKHRDMNVWISCASIDPASSKRGTSADMRRLNWLPIDLDVKPGSFASFEVAHSVVEDLSIMLGHEPRIVNNTGHGLQPWWLTDPEDPAWECDGVNDPRYVEILSAVRRWGRLVAHVASMYGVEGIDGVYDLARIMRAPGTTNIKPSEENVEVSTTEIESWSPVAFSRLLEILDEYGIRESPEDREVPAELILDVKNWPAPDATCAWAAQATANMRGERPRKGQARHPWLLGKAVRLAAMRRYGCLTDETWRQGMRDLSAAFTAACNDKDLGEAKAGSQTGTRPPAKGEFAGAMQHAVAMVQTWTDDKVEKELANRHGILHHHDDDASLLTEWVSGAIGKANGDQFDTMLDGPTTEMEPSTTGSVALDAEELVFESSDVLRFIRDHARNRMVAPWALLSGCLATVIGYTEPSLTIPAFVSTPASLNFGVVMAAGSGGGKSSAMGVTERLFEGSPAEALVGLTRRTPSSGEGIIALFTFTDAKGKCEQTQTRVLSVVDEIATLAAQSGRQGSTLMSFLRQAISGVALDTHASDRSRQRHLGRHAYRWCLVVATQNHSASFFLDSRGEDEGTPQRFLWCRTTDPKASKSAPPAGPNPFASWSVPRVTSISYPPGVEEVVRQAAEDTQRGLSQNLDGHAMLTRLKVAAGLALLHHSVQGTALMVTPELWEVSAHIMSMSTRVRSSLLAGLRKAKTDAAIGRALLTAEAEGVVADVKTERAVMLAARKVQRKPPGEVTTRRELDRSAGSSYREVIDEAIVLAVERGFILEAEMGERGGAGYLAGPVAVTS